MNYRVRYMHGSGEIARTYPMTREDAIEIGRQFIQDGEKEVLIEDRDGHVYSVDSL